MSDRAPWLNQNWFAVPLNAVGLSPRLTSACHTLAGKYIGHHAVAADRDTFTKLKIDDPVVKLLPGLAQLGMIELRDRYSFRFIDWTETLIVHRAVADRNTDTTLMGAREDAAGTRTPVDAELDTGARWVNESIRRARLPNGWHPESAGLDDPHDICSLQQAARRFMGGRINCRFGKSVDRLFHVLCNPGSRHLRSQVTLDGEHLVTLDVHQCHPTLLSRFVAPAERAEYLCMLSEGDVYTALGGREPSRGLAKARFQMLLAGTIVAGRYPLHAEFKRRFPETTAQLVGNRRAGESLQARLQSLEGRCVIGGLASRCAGESIPLISVHDGALCLQQHVERVEKIMVEEFQERVGVTVRIHR